LGRVDGRGDGGAVAGSRPSRRRVDRLRIYVGCSGITFRATMRCSQYTPAGSLAVARRLAGEPWWSRCTLGPAGLSGDGPPAGRTEEPVPERALAWSEDRQRLPREGLVLPRRESPACPPRSHVTSHHALT